MQSNRGREISRRRFLQQASIGAGGLSAGLWLAGGLLPIAARAGTVGPAATRQRVLVLGAGLAGLAAAWELEEAGHEVTVLEARTRPGGRVHTLREPFADGLWAEAGAVAYSESYREAIRYIDALGLERQPWPMPDLRQLYHLGGRRFAAGPEDSPAWPYELTAEERRLGPFGLLQRYVIDTLPPEIRDPEAWSRPPLIDLDAMTLGEYMLSQGSSPGAVEMIRDTQYFGLATDRGSALSVAVSDIGLFFGGMPFVLAGGNDRLPRAMAARLGGRIEYGVEVVSVTDSGRAVKVSARRAGRLQRWQADRLVCTIPANVLRGISIEPALPEPQRRAIAELPYLDALRTYVQVRRPFWREEGVTGGAPTDLPIGMVNEQPGPDGNGDGRVLIESYVSGPAATELAARPDGEIVEEVLGHLEKVHPQIRRHAEGAVVVAWSRDPYTRGHVSWPNRGEVARHLRELQRPHGRIHFAGEHTSILRSTMEGALRSGMRAAAEISAWSTDRPERSAARD